MPRLIALCGPLAGRTFPLDAGDGSPSRFSIGRQQGCDIQLRQGAVSRRHCHIELTAAGFRLVDSGSRLGTFINGIPVRDRQLHHGDRISIGGSTFLFLVNNDEKVADDSEGSSVVESTAELLPEEIRDIRSLASEVLFQAEAIPSDPAQPDLARDLRVLFDLSTALQESDHAERLAERLLTLLGNALPAHRGCVLLRGAAGELTPVVVRHQDGSEAPFPISRTVLDRVLAEGIALLADEIRRHDSLRDAESLASSGVRSLLCLPIARGGESLGVLYFDTPVLRGLTRHHLELAAAAAASAALAFDNARNVAWLRSENRRLRTEQLGGGMIGESPAVRDLHGLLGRVAPTNSTVLLLGESGSGKELAARAIHEQSRRAEGPFVAINCAALQEALLESELFGHEKGAFTGAVARQVGKLEAAHGGTLFLDEMGEIPLAVQARLLRVLQERTFERVGSSRSIQVDLRLVAATNRDLEAAIREGGFRQDLYYRLNVISLRLPPLRERGGDILLLARNFSRLHGERIGRAVTGPSPAAAALLLAYPWPGNVRQLSNVIERAVVLGADEMIHPEDLPDEIHEGARQRSPAPVSDFQATLTATKKKLILDAYTAAGGDHTVAAGSLGIHVNSLHRLVRQLDLRPLLAERFH